MRSRPWRVQDLILADESRTRMSQPWQFNVVTHRDGEALDIVGTPKVAWRWAGRVLKVDVAGHGDVVGRFENASGRFKVIRSAVGISVVPDDLPPRVDGC